jgi:hypothetical protein
MKFKIVPLIYWDNFFLSYFENDEIPFYYAILEEPNNPVSRNVVPKPVPVFNGLRVVNCIPPYLRDLTLKLQPGLGVMTKSYRLGYLIDLSDFKNPEEYLKSVLGSSTSKKLRRDFRKLTEFNSLRFSIFYGEIDKIQYETFMNSLKAMITTRFSEKNTAHSALQRWDFYSRNAYDMLKQGHASLFVYSISDNPISIGLNYHKENVLYSAITSFNSEYAHLGFGKLMLFNRIKWCLDNGYTKIDLGWGDFDYKKKFANFIYEYQTQIIFREKKVFDRIAAYFLSYFLKRKYRFNLKSNFKDLSQKRSK